LKRVILALDVYSVKAAEEAVRRLKDQVAAFKIGFELFVSAGPDVVRAVQAMGGKVFLDLKFHDIPNTAAQAARVAARMGVDFFDLHASGGRAMMTAVKKAVDEEAAHTGKDKPVILGVTVLTSLTEKDLREDLNVANTPEAQVVALARLAHGCGMGGVVASPREVSAIRGAVGREFVIVTPGVRPTWAGTDDQQRVATPAEAVKAGADYLVIGRPILKAADPVEAAIRINEELAGINPD
jgi:orotidine-5'-phosphate decarboxylase